MYATTKMNDNIAKYRIKYMSMSMYYTSQQGKIRPNNSYLIYFYKLYCIHFWSPFLLELKTFCEKLFRSSENHHMEHFESLSDKKL